MRLRWDAAPWLLVPVPFLAAPAATLWISAALQAVGLGRPLDAVVSVLGPSAGAEAAFGARMLFLVVFFGLPALAFAFAFFAFFSGELAIEDWTVQAQLQLPRPPWGAVQVIGAALLVATALLTLAVAAHALGG